MYPQTLARPYALAAFTLSAKTGAENAWQSFLNSAVSLIANRTDGKQNGLAQVFGDPRVNDTDKAEIFLSAFAKAGGKFADGEAGKLQAQFIRVLAEKNRLLLLPQIAELFAQKFSAKKGEYPVHIESAYPLGTGITDLSQKLEKVFGVKLVPSTSENAELIGGFRAQVGDKVLDCSLRSTLEKAKKSLAN